MSVSTETSKCLSQKSLAKYGIKIICQTHLRNNYIHYACGNILTEAYFQHKIKNSVNQPKLSASLAIPDNQIETLGPIFDLVQLNW
jgi:hypothetical protein